MAVPDYIKVYMRFFGYQIKEDIICEVKNDGTPGVNVHHINGRIGKNKLDINGLIALNYDLHDAIHTQSPPYTKAELMQIHAEFMAKNGIKHV